MKIFKGIPIRNECIASYFFNMFSRKLSYWFLQIITSHLPTSVWLISAQHVCLTSGHLVITINAYHYNCRPVKWSVHLQLAYVPHWHFCKTCRIMFTSHVSELTVNTCCWCDICSNICKHETIRYFYLTSGQFPATFAVTEPGQPEHYLSVFFCGDIQSTSTVRAAEIEKFHQSSEREIVDIYSLDCVELILNLLIEKMQLLKTLPHLIFPPGLCFLIM